MTVAAGATLSLVWPTSGNEAAEQIALQPFGSAIASAQVDRIRSALASVYAVPVSILPTLPLPQRAFYAPRHRYRADRLLEVLGARLPREGTRILGLTGADISTTKGHIEDWGILGLAHLGGTAGIVSSFRCAHGAHNAAHASDRFIKVSVHEMGHCFGLPHCPNAHCIMQDADSRIATIDDGSDLCDTCRARLAVRGIHVSARRSNPWS